MKERGRKKIHRWHKGIQSPSPTSRSMSSQPPSNGCLSQIPSPRFYCWTWYSVLLWLVWVCLHCVSFKLLAHPQPTHYRDRVGRTLNTTCEACKAVRLCKCRLATAQTLLCYQRDFSYTSKTQHHSSCHKENWLLPGRTQYTVLFFPFLNSILVFHLCAPILSSSQVSMETWAT